jgi:AcrR family transcriptional regulator
MKALVKTKPRTLRAEQAERTRQRIIAAAQSLFLSTGFPSTTLQAIADEAGVSVETIYSRFRNKTNLLAVILEQGIVPTEDGRDIFDLPEIEQIRATTDQRKQVRLLAAFSRGILQRTHAAHSILRSAAEVDDHAAELQKRDTKRRIEGQRTYIDMLRANGPLRRGLSQGDAAETYSVLASPESFAFLVDQQGWPAEKFETWLGDSLARLLL